MGEHEPAEKWSYKSQNKTMLLHIVYIYISYGMYMSTKA